MSSPTVRVVLVRTLYAGNVGAALRAAANFAAAGVTLVGPRCDLDDPELIRMAMGAQGHVEVSSAATLAEALAPCDAAIATTSGRNRDSRHIHPPAEVRALLGERGARRIALVFGPERGGLTLGELRDCHLLMSVPTNPAFPVLNLAQTVAVSLALLSPAPSAGRAPADPLDAPAPAVELRDALDHLAGALGRCGFLDPKNPHRVMDQIGRLLARSLPSSREAAILRGIAAEIERLLGPGPDDKGGS